MAERARLIALIDFSIYSHAIAELANRWCAIANAELLLFHKIYPLVPGMTDGDLRAGMVEVEKEEALAKLKKLATEKFPANLQVKFHVAEGHMLSELSDLVKGRSNDYLLVGVKGKGMLKKILMGSTATEIINELNAPIVAVPEKLCVPSRELCNLAPRNIVVSINDRYALNEAAFTNFLNAFHASVGQIKFVSVVPPEGREKTEHYLEEVQKKYNDKISSTYVIFEGKDPLDEIKKNVRVDNDTVLVVQRGSRSFTDQLFRKFLISKLVHDGSIPLLVLPEASR